MSQSHILGLPRIGAHRELKKAVEAYWQGKISLAELKQIGQQIEESNWKLQADAGLDFVTVGDFTFYDHVLDTSALLGVIPSRFKENNQQTDLNTVFCMARGQAPDVKETSACEMTKWFNTNYHYIVPEFSDNQTFQLTLESFFESIQRAQALGHSVKPVLLGPLTYLWLGKAENPEFDKLNLLKQLTPAYNEILNKLRASQIDWVQIDEPILVLDLPEAWQKAYIETYKQLNFTDLNCLLATYFGSVTHHLSIINQLPVNGIHVDLCSAPQQLDELVSHLSKDKVLSAGIVSGRNIWRTDLEAALNTLKKLKSHYAEKLWIATSCSLLHVPVDLDNETKLDAELKSWLAYAKQKVAETALLAKALDKTDSATAELFSENQAAMAARRTSRRIHNPDVQNQIKSITPEFGKRKNEYRLRAQQQRASLALPLLPTTTIGSFPQTTDIRKIRQTYKAGTITIENYKQQMQAQIADVIARQEELSLDVLVHGEAERNDMVEYFGELLNGFAFTENGWVQSYGSRCVKPPIIYGDVSRPQPMTVEWAQYAQSLSKRPVKGMLTGPVTILAWSFVRDDQTHEATAMQIALALRQEVTDLEKAGIKIIQIDEPAFREALPLQRKDWKHYLNWSVFSFRVASCDVQDDTQIHTHMCYSEFNDVIEAIAALDADVITLESSRSKMELLQAFEHFAYPNEIGPGVYDIHSPRVPTTEEIVTNLENALRYIPIERLWVNPDCGLKTRNWPEVTTALQNMVNAAKFLREEKQGKAQEKSHELETAH